MDYFVVGWTLAIVWILVLFLDWIQSFIIGPERIARILCRVFSNRIRSLLIYWPLYTITTVVYIQGIIETRTIVTDGLIFQAFFELPISLLLVPLIVYMHTDEEDVIARWVEYKLRKSETLEEDVKSLLVRKDKEADPNRAKLLTSVIRTVCRNGDTFGYNVRKIVEDHEQSRLAS